MARRYANAITRLRERDYEPDLPLLGINNFERHRI